MCATQVLLVQAAGVDAVVVLTVAEILVKEFIRMGVPMIIHSDQGRNFES